MTTFESTIRQINYPQQNVYNKLSDLSNLQALKERYELMKDTMPEEARQQAEKIKDMTFDADSLSVNVPPVGSIRLRIVDRDEPKCIKFESEQSPIPFNFWIQLLPVTSTTSKMKLTIKAELNMFIKQTPGSPDRRKTLLGHSACGHGLCRRWRPCCARPAHGHPRR